MYFCLTVLDSLWHIKPLKHNLSGCMVLVSDVDDRSNWIMDRLSVFSVRVCTP